MPAAITLLCSNICEVNTALEIHVVKPGDSLYSIAQEYGIPMSRIIEDNEINPAAYLVIGQTLVIQIPSLLHTVQPGQTLSQIANMYGLSLRQLYRNNPSLEGCSLIYPGQS